MNKIIYSLKNPISIEKKLSVAIGFFDGVHLGHRLLLDKIKSENEDISILTFDSNMKSNLFHREPNLLLSEKEKDEMFSLLDVKNEIIFPFDEEMMNMDKEDFLSLLASFHFKRIVVGFDFSFGKNALGHVSDLKRLEDKTCKVDIIAELKDDEYGKYSSTNIKKLLLDKKIEEANKMLSYPFFITNKVVHGLENGRKISYPTANMNYPKEKLKLPSGVYKTMTLVDDKKYLSMTNIGSHPSIDKLNNDIIETHIFSFDEDIYDKEIRVYFLSYLREQKTFSSLNDLKKQLDEDKKKANS